MSRHNRERRQRNKGPRRTVSVGIEADTPTHSRMGVCIGWEGDEAGKTVIAPDEARTMAAKLEGVDPDTARKLRTVADGLPHVLAAMREQGYGVSLVDPKITGPHALGEWLERWREQVRAGYREALAAGYPANSVVWATPLTESLDDPPVSFNLHSPAEAREMLNKVSSKPGDSMTPLPGSFFVVASRAEGRFKGTYTGVLSAREGAEPEVAEGN